MRPAADPAPASLASSSQSARRAQPQAAPGHAPAAVAAAGLTPGRAEPPARRRGPAPPQAPIGRPRPIKGEADAAGRVEAGPASRGLPRGGPIEGVVCGRGGALVGRGFGCAEPQAPYADPGAGMGTGRRLCLLGGGAALPSLVVLRLPYSLRFLGAVRVRLDSSSSQLGKLRSRPVTLAARAHASAALPRCCPFPDFPCLAFCRKWSVFPAAYPRPFF